MTRPDADCPIVGTWRLVRYEVTPHGDQEGRKIWADTNGLLIYGADGTLSVHLSNRERTNFAAARRWDGTTEEKAQAFDDYLAYAGTFRWEDDRVIHVIEHCIFPNWIGGEQLRYADLDGDVLTLTNHVAREDSSVSLIWKRDSAQ